MKLIELTLTPICTLLIWALLVPSAAATNYYLDDTNGNDSWTGTAENYQGGGIPPDGPWKSLSKIESFGSEMGFQAGDQILFKRGETFITSRSVFTYSSGDAQTQLYIDIGAYGIGAKPILQLSGQKLSGSIFWEDQGNGIWLYTYGGSVVNGLWKDGVYLKHASDATLFDGDFYWDEPTG